MLRIFCAVGRFVPYAEALERIVDEYGSLEKVTDESNDTSKHYRVPGFRGRIGKHLWPPRIHLFFHALLCTVEQSAQNASRVSMCQFVIYCYRLHHIDEQSLLRHMQSNAGNS